MSKAKKTRKTRPGKRVAVRIVHLCHCLPVSACVGGGGGDEWGERGGSEGVGREEAGKGTEEEGRVKERREGG